MDADEKTSGLSDAQEKALILLVFPSTMLSLFGSSVIIFVALRSSRIASKRKWTPYTRLLIGLSIYDIIFSIQLCITSFLRPRDTSTRIWAFGNDATCTASAFLGVIAHGAIFYNGCLSFYFLLSARFGLKNSTISKRIEPFMHFISTAYPLATAISALVLDIYGESVTSLGCWASDFEDESQAQIMGLLLYGMPYGLVYMVLVINNVIIWLFVRSKTKPLQTRSCMLESPKSEVELPRSQASDVEDASVTSSLNELDPNETSIEDPRKLERLSTNLTDLSSRADALTQQTKQQLRRLKWISSQAFLYVASFFICVIWVGLLAGMENRARDSSIMLTDIYPIMVLNSIFSPLQGLFNMLVYIRPKFLNVRHKYPHETRWWAIRRSILGDGLQPESEKSRNYPCEDNEATYGVARALNSSIAKQRKRIVLSKSTAQSMPSLGSIHYDSMYGTDPMSNAESEASSVASLPEEPQLKEPVVLQELAPVYAVEERADAGRRWDSNNIRRTEDETLRKSLRMPSRRNSRGPDEDVGLLNIPSHRDNEGGMEDSKLPRIPHRRNSNDCTPIKPSRN